MEPSALVLIAVLIGVLIIFTREAFVKPRFLLTFAASLLVVWLIAGNPAALLVSAGGWIILLVMIWVAQRLPMHLRPGRNSKRAKPGNGG